MFGLFKKSKPDEPIENDQDLKDIERRQSGRRNVFADALARSDGGREIKRGIVLDLSAQGARIRLEYSDNLVEGMTLRIPRYGLTAPVLVRWSHRQDVGVEFVNEDDVTRFRGG